MKAGRPFSFAALAAPVFFIACAMSSAMAMAFDCKASPDKSLDILASVLSFHQGEYSKSGPVIKVFEIGGGDPAMNGAFIYVHIEHESAAYTWKTGLNVRKINKIKYAPGNVIIIEADEDFMDDRQSISLRKRTYTIRFHLTGNALKDTLSIESK
ncbi:MAG: hypothetical protein ACOZEN_07955 [Thermodesulfobacteriota bacterium]|jgi:hypothetical protein